MYVYETTHPIAYSADEMFALIADVDSYPRYLPLCEDLTVTRREHRDGKEILIARMAVGYKMIRESFTTRVTLDRLERAILVEYLDGPFSFLENRWHFVPRAAGGCDIEFYIAYSFRSRLLERVMGGLFAKAVRKYTDAFEARAHEIYGKGMRVVASHSH
jgi:coenzyme Q-binding protein COQ10